MKGRPYNTRELAVSKINRILELTELGYSKPDISEIVGVSTSTVWRYQKKHHLLEA